MTSVWIFGSEHLLKSLPSAFKSRLNHSKEFFDISHGCGVGAATIPQRIPKLTPQHKA